MDPTLPLPLLGGLSPQTFMRRHWQKTPLLVRQALPGVRPPVSRGEAFELAARDGIESRLVVRDVQNPQRWTLRHGPLSRRALPPLRQPRWTLLVQGVDLVVPAAHELLARFRFVPDARLDDLMVSYATDGGGVGPHLDSYDVFLIQVQGRRRWRIGRVADDTLVDSVPLRILRHFVAEQEWLLEPGDMLYLPPRWGHDGVAAGECMTCSVGFRAPSDLELASGVLARLADAVHDGEGRLYRDAAQAATATPARMPSALRDFAAKAVAKALSARGRLDCALGELLTEPKPHVWFDAVGDLRPGDGVTLDVRTRMMYDDGHVYINGDALRAGGRDARLLARLADRRRLAASDLRRLSAEAREVVGDWVRSGWLHGERDGNE